MIRSLILLIAVGVAILFGGTPDWARSLAIAAIGALTLFSGISYWREDYKPLNKAEVFAALLFVGVLLWGFVTAIPGSAAFVANGPASQIASALTLDAPSTLSVSPAATVEALFWMIALGAWLYCVHLAARRHDSFARVSLWTVVAMIVAFAFYGLTLRALGLELVLWHEKQAYVGALTGPLINKNHFATMLGLALVCVTALLFEIRDRAPRQSRMRKHGVGSALTGIRFERIAALLIAFGVLITALVLTQSRAGTVASLFGLFVVLLFGLIAGRRAMPIIGGAVLLGFAALAVFAFQDDGLVNRFQWTEGALEGRMVVYETVAGISRNYPLTGTGLGTFEEVFRMKKPETISSYFDMAHNTYLELGMELGWPATIALMLTFVMFVGLLLQGLRNSARSPAPYLAALGATAVVGSHALFDFSMQIPAITLIYLLILGAALGHDRA